MKKIALVLLVLISSGVQANIITNFYADFSGAVNGPANATNLAAGTTVGTWTLHSETAESIIDDGIFYAGIGEYDYRGNMEVNAAFSDQAVFEMRLRHGRPDDGATFNIRFFGDNSLLLNTRYFRGGAVQRWDGSNWVGIGSGLNATADNPGSDMNVIRIEFGTTDYEFFINGDSVGTFDYQTAGNVALQDFRLQGGGATTAGWYDDIKVTTIPEPASAILLTLSAGGLLLFRRFRSV